MTMTIEEVLSRLCTYDDRNPNGAHTFMDKEDYEEAKAGTDFVENHKDEEVRRMFGHHFRSFRDGAIWERETHVLPLLSQLQEMREENERLKASASFDKIEGAIDQMSNLVDQSELSSLKKENERLKIQRNKACDLVIAIRDMVNNPNDYREVCKVELLTNELVSLLNPNKDGKRD